MLELVSGNHEVLTQELPQFDFENPPLDPKELANQLFEVMEKNNGLGLAANQVGLQHRVFVLNCNPKLACFNPRIVYTSDDYSVGDEGCLTWPGFVMKVRRPKNIRIRFQDETGQTKTESLGGLVARVAQHELDHLNGITFFSRAKKHHIEQAKRKFELNKRKLKKVINYV